MQTSRSSREDAACAERHDSSSAQVLANFDNDFLCIQERPHTLMDLQPHTDEDMIFRSTRALSDTRCR